MEISYKRSPNISYMIVEKDESIPGFAVRMLKENNIPWLLSFSESESGDRVSVWFDITGKKSLRTFFSQEGITQESLLIFLRGLSDCINAMGKYLLNPEYLLLDVDTVFMGRDGYVWKTGFAYIAQPLGGYAGGFSKIMEYLIRNIDHKDPDMVKICYEMFELSQQGEISLDLYMEIASRNSKMQSVSPVVEEEIETVLNSDEKEDIYESIWEDPREEKRPMSSLKKPRKLSMGLIIDKYIKPAIASKKNEILPKAPDVDDIILDPIPYSESLEKNTGLLSGEKENYCLCYLGRGPYRDICIEKTPFRIGSRPGDNDAVIPEKVISRYHAVITKQEGVYYIEDLESKNGTFVNGKILEFRNRKRLNPGDRISFANIGYRFE